MAVALSVGIFQGESTRSGDSSAGLSPFGFIQSSGDVTVRTWGYPLSYSKTVAFEASAPQNQKLVQSTTNYWMVVVNTLFWYSLLFTADYYLRQILPGIAVSAKNKSMQTAARSRVAKPSDKK